MTQLPPMMPIMPDEGMISPVPGMEAMPSRPEMPIGPGAVDKPLTVSDYPKIPLSDSERKELGLILKRRIEASWTAMAGRREKWLSANRHYENQVAPKTSPWRGCANVHIPMTSYHVDGISTRLNRVMFSAKPMLLCEPLLSQPLAEGDSYQRIEAEALQAEEWMETILRKEVRWPSVGRDANMMVTKEGNAPLALHWTQFKRRKGYVESDGDGMMIVGDREEVEREGPEIVLVNNEDFLLYPADAPNIETAIGCARRLRLRWDDLRRRQVAGVYEGIEKVLPENLQPIAAQEMAPTDQQVAQNDIEGVTPTPRQELQDKEFEVWEGVWRYAWKDGFERDYLFTIDRATGILLQAEFYPYFHGRRYFVSMRILPRPNRYYGQGIAEKIEHLQEEGNTLHNQRIDAQTISINRPFLHRRLSDVGDQELRFAPGEKWAVDDVTNDIRQLDVAQVPMSFAEEERQILQFAERVTGLSDFGAGMSPEGRRRTLGEVESVLSEAGLRFDDMIKAAHDVLPEMATQIWELYGQFAPESRPPINGWKPTWVPQGDSVNTSRQAQVAKAQAVYDKLILGQNPLTVTNPQRVYAVTREWLRRMDWKDIEGAIGKEEESPQAMAQMQAMIAAQQQPGGNDLGSAGPGGGGMPTGEEMIGQG